jgi:hypothetical protein
VGRLGLVLTVLARKQVLGSQKKLKKKKSTGLRLCDIQGQGYDKGSNMTAK